MIRQPVYFYLSMVLLLAAAWFAVDRAVFLHSAQKTTGTVQRIDATNSRCGGRRYRHDCTIFKATVAYSPSSGDARYTVSLSAGSVRGYSQPVSQAAMAYNQAVRLVYNPARPAEAYEDSFYGVWKTPLLIFFFQMAAFLAGLTQPRVTRWL